MGLFTPLAGIYFADDLKAQGSSGYRFAIVSDAAWDTKECGWQPSPDGSTLGVVDISPAGSAETLCKNQGIPYHRLPKHSADEAKAWVCRNVLPRLLPIEVSFR